MTNARKSLAVFTAGCLLYAGLNATASTQHTTKAEAETETASPRPQIPINAWRVNDAHELLLVRYITGALGAEARDHAAAEQARTAHARTKPIQNEGTVGSAAVAAPDPPPADPGPTLAEREAYWSNPTNWTANWDGIADCESGGDWSINTGNGYYGGLQENIGFWDTYGDTGNWSRPDLAPKWAQIEAAEGAKKTRGLRPWSCGYRG